MTCSGYHTKFTLCKECKVIYLAILAIWLALCGAIYSRIAPCFKSHLFLSQWEWDSETKQPISFQGSFKVINEISGKWRAKSHCVENFATAIAKTVILFLQKLCNSKMDLIKWQLNFVSCNFGLKSYLWFQIELALRACSILKSLVWSQTKLHSTQFNYHYISPSPKRYITFAYTATTHRQK